MQKRYLYLRADFFVVASEDNKERAMTIQATTNNTQIHLVTPLRVAKAKSFYESLWWLYVGGAENALQVIDKMDYSAKILFLAWMRGQIILGWQVFIEHLQNHEALPFNNAPKRKPYSLIGDASGRTLFDFMQTLDRKLAYANAGMEQVLNKREGNSSQTS